MQKVLSMRLPEEILESIEEIAHERKRSRGDVIREAIEYYLENWADYQIALDRLKDASDKVLSEKEFLDELGWDI
ncbi:MAG: ribbon-helix-helix protein, CopG family [Deltaproteobacteria bacterium]|nr:ribbon-helix-helix protein, CopG family [Deltaproteobacteria bacterium]